MMTHSKIMTLVLGVALLHISADAQRQRGRGQYGRRAVADAEVEEAHLQPVLLETTLRPKIYETHRSISPNLGDGNFKYYSATSDGLQSEQVGHFSNPLYSQVHQGSYTTKDEFGQVVQVDYIADKNGFQPIGAGGVPVAPPVPLEHAKAREDILRLQAQIRDQHQGHHRAAIVTHAAAHAEANYAEAVAREKADAEAAARDKAYADADAAAYGR